MPSYETTAKAATGVVAGIGCLWVLGVIAFWALVIAALLKFVFGVL